MKSKMGNKVLDKKIFSVRGIQVLTGRVSARANEISAGIYHVKHEGEDVDDYAKGERVVIKIYLKDVRFERQINTNLTELTIWLTLEEYIKMRKLKVRKSLVSLLGNKKC